MKLRHAVLVLGATVLLVSAAGAAGGGGDGRIVFASNLPRYPPPANLNLSRIYVPPAPVGSRPGILIVVPVDGGAPRVLATIVLGNSPNAIGPRWSPDGARLAYIDGRQLRVIGVGGGEPEILTRPAADTFDFYPDWSPDGRLIAFARLEDHLPRNVFVVSANGGPARQVTHEDAHALIASMNPLSWSPDGKHLVTQGDKLRIVSTDGETERILETGSIVPSPLRNFTNGPSWQTRCTVEGDGRGNRLRGGSGNDVVCGLGGADTITGGRGRDRLFGEEGNDTIVSRDRAFDIVGCGSGHDTAVADRIDLVGVDCERVERR